MGMTDSEYTNIDSGRNKSTPDNSLMSLDGMILGMPPGTHVSNNLMYNSMPTATIIPCDAEFTQGLSLFRLDHGKGLIEYQKILNNVGFTIPSGKIKIAYLADNFPTDTFNNEYGETFLDKFSQVASGALGDIAQIAGVTNSEEAISSGKKFIDAMTGGPGSSDFIAGKVNAADEASKNFSGKHQGIYQQMKSGMKAMLTGARVDFPLVWKNSSFTPSYTMTVRLYNPNPANEEATKRYIVGPIAALVALGIPRVGEDSSTYKWPLLCKIRSPGIYHLNAAYINSISIVKGGDQQGIAYNQALSICDVRIEFGCLYNSILSSGENDLGGSRPTLGSYLEAIGGIKYTGADQKRDIYELKKGKNNLEKNIDSRNSIRKGSVQTSEKETNVVNSRVSSVITKDYDDLKRKSGFS